MTREEFYENVEQFILGMLPEEFSALSPQVQQHVNQTGHYTGLSFVREESGPQISPVFNLDASYDRYGEMDRVDMLTALADDIVRGYHSAMSEQIQKSADAVYQLSNYENAKEHLFLAPASLARVEAGAVEPCKWINDIAIQVRILITNIPEGQASIVVTPDVLSVWGKEFSEVYAEAEKNTPTLCPTKIVAMADLVGDLDVDLGDPDIPAPDLWVIGNDQHNHGAANVFLPGVMEEIAERVGGSYFLVPSSVHEVIIQPLVLGEPDAAQVQELDEMIREINVMQVAPEERLANHAYFYDAKTGEFMEAYNMLLKKKEENKEPIPGIEAPEDLML